MRICIECGGPIEADQDWEELPNNEAIHEECMNSILDKPVSGEKEGTQTSREVTKEWWC